MRGVSGLLVPLIVCVAAAGCDTMPVEPTDGGLPDSTLPDNDGGVDSGVADSGGRDGGDEDASADGGLAPLGTACAVADRCESGICTDGVCCDAICGGECESCGLADSLGTCRPHALGTDLETECGAGLCDGRGLCAVGATRWALGFSGTAGIGNHTFVEDIAISDSAVVIVGRFTGVVSFGGSNLVSSGASDMFVARYDRDGAHVSSVRFGTNIAGRNTSALGVSLNAAGNAVVVGSYDGAAGSGVNFGGNVLTHTGQRDIFVAEIAGDGSPVRAVGFGGTLNDVGNDVAITSDGRVLVGGQLSGTVSFGGTDLTSEGMRDALILSLDATFGVEWAVSSGGVQDDVVVDLAVDSSGAVVATGAFRGDIDFGGTPESSLGFEDIFLVKLDPSGALDWLQTFGDTSGQQSGQSVAIGQADSILMAGHVRGGADFGDGPLIAEGTLLSDFFLASFEADGTHVWSRLYGDDDLQSRIAVDIDDVGNISVVTGYEGLVDFGAPMTAIGQEDISVSRLGADGTHLWSHSFGDAADQYASVVAVDAAGSAFVAGKLFGSVDFGLGALTDGGAGFGIFVARFDP